MIQLSFSGNRSTMLNYLFKFVIVYEIKQNIYIPSHNGINKIIQAFHTGLKIFGEQYVLEPHLASSQVKPMAQPYG